MPAFYQAAFALGIWRRGGLLGVVRLGRGAIRRRGDGGVLRFNRAIAAGGAGFFAGNLVVTPDQQK